MKKKLKAGLDTSVDRISEELALRYRAAVAASGKTSLHPKTDPAKTVRVFAPDAHKSVAMGSSDVSLHYSLRTT